MAISSKTQICNMALSHLGNFGTVNNIDTPATKKEKTFALWYDITRQVSLKTIMPNFALTRKMLAINNNYTPPFGYSDAYSYPSDCLKVLGFDEVSAKEKNYVIESDGTQTVLLTDTEYTDGLPLRYIRDVEDVTEFSPEYIIQLSWELAVNVALEVTQDAQKAQVVMQAMAIAMSNTTALNAQENPPIRISTSRFKRARYDYSPTVDEKK